VLMIGVRVGTLYKLLGRINTSESVNAVVPKIDQISSCVVNSSMLWHQRMGHIIKKNLHAMHSKGMVEGVPDFSSEIDFCEHCVYGKQCQVKFPFGATRAKGILEAIHSNVFGPMSVPSLGGSVYYVSFIDDFFIMKWLYFLKKKSKVFERFQEFKILMQN